MTEEEWERRRAEWLAGPRRPGGREPELWEVEASLASMDVWDAAEREQGACAAAVAAAAGRKAEGR